MPPKQVISPKKLPPVTLPLSRAIKVGNQVFVSGTTPNRDASGAWSPDVRAQVRGCLENIKAILEEAGASLKDVVTVTSYLKSRSFFEAYNEEYRKFFPSDFPARTTVQAELMNPDLLVEISCIAVMSR